jgi:hypothetical protein
MKMDNQQYRCKESRPTGLQAADFSAILEIAVPESTE